MIKLAMALLLIVSCGESAKEIAVKGKRAGPKKAIEETAPIRVIKLARDPVLAWQHKDLKLNSMFGVSADNTYEKFKLKQTREIVVAVIDSGVDHRHPDLKQVMWKNTYEIPGNGIDDDNNGYIDDVYGWNFIGGVDGRNINDETLEQTRIYKKLLDKLSRGEILTSNQKTLFDSVKTSVETELTKHKKDLKAAEIDQSALTNYLEVLRKKWGIEELNSREAITALSENDPELKAIKLALLEIWDKYWRGFRGIKNAIKYAGYYVNVGLNIHFNARAEIVGDDPADFSDSNYGNNDVIGPDASHGTHVAGIIAASRNNNLGMNGIAANVKIMALRAVPNGDERDKDIALAVRYAVDNGAHIINMSFGKSYSAYKEQVDAAFEYAAGKGVLLVHAAGNSSKSVDGGKNNYPNSYKLAEIYRVNTIGNWLEVAANTKDKGLNLPASFTNYGTEAATLFAPGHKIYSTIPGGMYAAFSGTSMAAPVVSGVAALLLSEFPSMTAKEARDILINTVEKPMGLMVRKPDQNATTPDFRIPVPFEDLSQSGGVINAYHSMKLAKQLEGE